MWADTFGQLPPDGQGVVFSFLSFSTAAAAPKKKIQTTLTNLVVKGVDTVLQETKQKLGNSR